MTVYGWKLPYPHAAAQAGRRASQSGARIPAAPPSAPTGCKPAGAVVRRHGLDGGFGRFRFTYRSSAALTTDARSSPRASAVARAARYNSSGIRNPRIGVFGWFGTRRSLPPVSTARRFGSRFAVIVGTAPARRCSYTETITAPLGVVTPPQISARRFESFVLSSTRHAEIVCKLSYPECSLTVKAAGSADTDRNQAPWEGTPRMYDTTPRIRRRYCPISIGACIVAALVMFPSAVLGIDVVYHAALTAFLLAATALVTLRTGVNAEVIEAARQAGYDAGYQDKEALLRETQPVELRRIV